MKLTILFILLLYYGLCSIFFIYATPYIGEGYNSTITGYDVEIPEPDFDITKFFLFLGFGIGLPEDTPTFFNVIFITWQTIMFMMTLGFLYQAIRGS